MSEFQPTHRHYKGGLYQLVGRAMHTETEENLVVYRGEDGALWARPNWMFFGTHDGVNKRFEPLPAPSDD